MHLGLCLIHVVVGILIACHGSQKLFGGFSPAGIGQAMESLGLGPGTGMVLAAGVNELVGGVLLALGLLVPVAAALIGASYLVAARTAHRGQGPWNHNGGWEYVLVLSTVALGLAFNGAGEWSLDHAIGWEVSGFWWGFGAAVVAVIGAAAGLGGEGLLRPRPRGTAGQAADAP